MTEMMTIFVDILLWVLIVWHLIMIYRYHTKLEKLEETVKKVVEMMTEIEDHQEMQEKLIQILRENY